MSSSPSPCEIIDLDVLALPPDAATIILQMAGLHTRQVSRAFRALHPPLQSLAPCDLNSARLKAALAALPPTLTCLDLTLVPLRGGYGSTTHPYDAATFANIAATLPRLRELRLSRSVPMRLVPGILRALQSCPHFRTLSLSNGYTYGWLPATSPYALLLTPPLATRLRSLSLILPCASQAFKTIHHAAAGSLPQLTAFFMNEVDNFLSVAQVAAFAAAAPALRSFDIGRCWSLVHTEHLARLSTLTALRVHEAQRESRLMAPSSARAPGQLFPRVAALTNLRSLTLRTEAVWTRAAAGWLSRLAQLSLLQIELALALAASDGPATYIATDVAASAARLPLLRCLEVELFAVLGAASPPWLACGQPDSFFRHLAAATQLQRLRLQNLWCPPGEVGALSSLQGLTALELDRCIIWHDPADLGPAQLPLDGNLPLLPRQWVSPLTNLQLFGWYGAQPESEPVPGSDSDGAGGLSPWQALADLPRLRTLIVVVPDWSGLSRPITDLLAAHACRLEHLHVGASVGFTDEPLGQVGMGPSVCRMLDGMACLDTLVLHGVEQNRGLLQHLRLPPSLRRCYVSKELHGSWELLQLQARYPVVFFKYGDSLEADRW